MKSGRGHLLTELIANAGVIICARFLWAVVRSLVRVSGYGQEHYHRHMRNTSLPCSHNFGTESVVLEWPEPEVPDRVGYPSTVQIALEIECLAVGLEPSPERLEAARSGIEKAAVDFGLEPDYDTLMLISEEMDDPSRNMWFYIIEATQPDPAMN